MEHGLNNTLKWLWSRIGSELKMSATNYHVRIFYSVWRKLEYEIISIIQSAPMTYYCYHVWFKTHMKTFMTNEQTPQIHYKWNQSINIVYTFCRYN